MYLKLFCAINIVLFFSSCKPEPKPKPLTPKVKCEIAQASKVNASKTLIAHVKAFRSIDIVARVDGFLEKRLFVEGSFIKKGTQLYQIEKTDYQLKLNTANAKLAKAQATALNALLEYQRARELYAQGVDAPKQFDIARANYNEAKSMVAAANSMVNTAALELSYTAIYAPFDGWIGLTNVDVGKYVKAPSQPLATLNDISKIRVEFNLPTSYLNNQNRQNLAKGVAPNFRVYLLDEQNNSIGEHGKIVYWNNFIAKTSATIQLQVCFKNPQFTHLPGDFVRVKVVDNTTSMAVLISPDTLRRSQAENFVYIVDKNSCLVLQAVTIEDDFNGKCIVKKGLNAGDRVVVAGNPRLTAGQTVDIIK